MAKRLSELFAPSLSDFETLAAQAFDGLPKAFRELCGEIVFRVEDFATDDVLDDLKAESPFDIMGLFQGLGMAHDQAIPETGRMPNMIFLYRRPILDYWAEHEESLGAVIAHVLIHEIGHHFGLSDADMAEIEAKTP